MMQGYNFTEHVRTVLAIAREEAVRLNHEYVSTQHILLALTHARPDSVAVGVFRSLGVAPDHIGQKVNEVVKPGQSPVEATDRPYTARAKKVLELGMSEARELRHGYVGTEHLLLGLLREEKGIAAQVLTQLGVTLAAARAEVLRHPTVVERAGKLASRREMGGAGSREPYLEEDAVRARFISHTWQRGFVALWMTLGIVVLIESVPPILGFVRDAEQANGYVAALASAEIIGAVLFLMPRTLKYGAWILLGVFAIAIVMHLARGEFPGPLFVYAAGTAFVLVQRR